MLERRLKWLLVLIAVGGVIALASLPLPCSHPAPIQSDETKKEGQSAEKYCPSTIRTIFVPAGNFIHDYKDEVTAFSTAIIAIFTTILGLFTISAAKSTRIAADTAKRSADAAIAIELPIIRAEICKLGYGTDQDMAGQKRHVCSVNNLFFSNLGRTKAFPVEVQFGWTFGNLLPTTPVYPFTKSFPINTIYEPDQGLREISLMEFEFEVPADFCNLLRDKSVNLWFYCNLIYLDFMQNLHEVGFCWKRQETFGAGMFRPDPAPDYNKKT